MKNIVFDYEVSNGDETMPMTVTMPINEDDEFITLSFTKESFRDIVAIAKNNGLQISIEEE